MPAKVPIVVLLTAAFFVGCSASPTTIEIPPEDQGKIKTDATPEKSKRGKPALAKKKSFG